MSSCQPKVGLDSQMIRNSGHPRHSNFSYLHFAILALAAPKLPPPSGHFPCTD